MQGNPRVYIKSHPKGEEDKPHMEIHFSIKGKEAEKPEGKLQKAIVQLSSLIEKSSGKVVSSA